MLVHQTCLNQRKDAIQLISALLIASQKLLLDVCIIGLILLQQLSVLVQPRHLRRQLLLRNEEILILLEEAVSGVFDYALHADVLIIGLAVKLVRLIMQRTKLMILADLLLLTCQLQHYEIFSQHVGLYLRVVLEAAGRAVQELLLVVDYRQALLADRVTAVEVPRGFLLGVV